MDVSPLWRFAPWTFRSLYDYVRGPSVCLYEDSTQKAMHGFTWFLYRNCKRYGRSYYKTLIGSRVCSVQWRHSRWPWTTFPGQTRRRYVSSWKTIPVRFWPCRRFAFSECSPVILAVRNIRLILGVGNFSVKTFCFCLVLHFWLGLSCVHYRHFMCSNNTAISAVFPVCPDQENSTYSSKSRLRPCLRPHTSWPSLYW